MSVLIKGMKMPTEGRFITIYKLQGEFYVSQNGELFPIIELPYHGDLIDRDALYIDLMDRGVDQLQLSDFAEIADAVDDAPAIIKAERSE